MKKTPALLWSLLAAGLTLVCLHYYSSGAWLAQSTIASASPEALQSVVLHEGTLRSKAEIARSEPDDHDGAEDDAFAREQWEIARHGFNLGVPQNAYANAMAQRRRMEAVSRAALAVRPAVAGPSWTFIGPMPMQGQVANFGGATFGTQFHATGRVSAIAIDPAGNIYVGTAGGGVWLSTNHGRTFSWIGKDLPTQSIGSIAVDITNTNPPTVYVGTGEGNSAIDTYYGLGLFSTQDFGVTWTPVDAAEFSSNGAYQAFTLLDVPCDHIFAGTGYGVSSSRGSSSISECEPSIFSTGFNCMQGAIYESRPPRPVWYGTGPSGWAIARIRTVARSAVSRLARL